ncbi:MAG: Stk1 family PASTA domain-containing Ser/Thr kinase [Eubacterium sp.]|nr:Stk1 family PASTA domain-containing Ser/Thr kinase [Eubacterium sp.]
MLEIGSLLAGRYEIREKIGVGGMSCVFKAFDHTLNRNVAIKALKTEFSEDPTFLAKFKAEAQSAACLAHPNIVNIYDVGADNGVNYIVMEYIEGITLKTYIELKGRLDFKESVSIAIQVAKGIEDAHKHHIVHRDIKPQNIMISNEGKAIVTDFGIARAASADTVKSDTMGSVHYISPEQARNGFVDGKSDIYSLGIVMYEMVTGRVPFTADTPVAVAVAHLQDEIVRPSVYAPDLPVSMEGIIMKCTQKNSGRRYETMTDLLNDLKRAHNFPDEDFVVIAEEEGARTILVSPDDINAVRSRNAVEADDDSKDYEDVEEDDDSGFLNPKMEKAVTILGIVAGVVIAGMVIFLICSMLGLFKFGSSSSGDAEDTEETVEVPDILGMTYDEALEELNEAGLGIKIVSYGDSDEYSEDEIMSQNPESGEEVEANTTIEVVISNGESDDDDAEEATMIDVTGMSEDEAKDALEEANISYGTTTYSYSDDVDAGDVISTDPAAGETIDDSTVVTITVSRGTQTVSVPTVTGLKKKKAVSTLEDSGFEVTVKEAYSDTVDKGYVIKQSPSAGSTVETGTTVTITVSLGEETTYVSVPDVTGDSISSAQSTLKNYGLKCSYTEEYSDSVEKGVVISQSPASGSSVEEGTTVTLVVSKGPETTVETEEDSGE